MTALPDEQETPIDSHYITDRLTDRDNLFNVRGERREDPSRKKRKENKKKEEEKGEIG